MQPMNLMEREAEMAYRSTRAAQQFCRAGARERRGIRTKRGLTRWLSHGTDTA
jgi:hypothetical protein